MILSQLHDWWISLSSPLQIFWGISIVSSVLFIIQFILSLIGLDAETDIEVDTDSDFSLDTDFTVFSIRSIIAFFTFFGWAGVLSLNNGSSLVNALIFAFVAGLASMFLVAYMLYTFSKFDERGNFSLESAIYNTGEVYLTIPAAKEGSGKINVSIDGAIRELDAITNGEALPSGTAIKIIDITDKQVLVVEPIQTLLENNN